MIAIEHYTIIIALTVCHFISIPLLFLGLFQYEISRYDYVFLWGRLLQLLGWLALLNQSDQAPNIIWSWGSCAVFAGWSLEALAIIALKYLVFVRARLVYISVFLASLVLILKGGRFAPLIYVTCLAGLSWFWFVLPGGMLLFAKQRSSALQKTIGILYCGCWLALVWGFTDYLAAIPVAELRLSNLGMLIGVIGHFLLGGMGYVFIKKEQLSRAMRAVADTDFLTGLLNRRAFLLLAEKLRHISIRRESKLTLLLIDIDRFKQINDRYGHTAGDEIIIHLAGILRKSMREADLACRYGGEEFIVLLPNCTHAGALQSGERIRQAVESSKLGFTRYTVSIGIARADGRQLQLHQLIDQADAAMYKAKELGRNRVQVFS